MTPPTDLKTGRRRRRRRIFAALILIAVVAAGCAGAYRVLKPRYLHWKAEKALAEARTLIAARDFPKAELALRVAVDSGAGTEAVDVYAELLEAANVPSAVEARRTALKVKPGNLHAELALAVTAMRFRDLETAREALQGCSNADKASAEYRRVAAIFALSARQPALADYFLTGLEKEDPSDANTHLLHTALLLRIPDPQKAASARKEMLAIAEDPVRRLAALRVLVDDALLRRDATAGRELGARLAATSGVTVNDLLVAATAEALGSADRRPGPDLALRISNEARKGAVGAELYVQWLLVQRRLDEAQTWIASLPANLSSNPVVHRLRAAVAIQRDDWASVRDELAAGAWGPLSPATLQFAFTAHSLRLKGETDLARQSWDAALAEAQGSESALSALARLARIWQWRAGVRDALLSTVRAFPARSENYPPLAALLRLGRESLLLQEVFGLWRGANPDLQTAQYNWALTTLLVAPSALPTEANKKMEELHAMDRSNPYYATGYALSLAQLGRTKEACEVMDSLGKADLELPARAPYLAFIYASGHRLDDARAAIKRAPRPENLLPEEGVLVSQAAAITGG
jgi:hypothetical protein